MAKQKANDPSAKVLKWIKEIQRVKESKAQQAFERHGEKIVKNYRNSEALQLYSSTSSTPSRVMYNVLWSNVQIQKPLLYARTPKIVVERRHKDASPVGRLSCKIAERSGSFMLSAHKDRFDFAVKSSVEDRLLPGRGVAFVRYDADFGQNADNDPVAGQEMGPEAIAEDGQGDDVELYQAEAPEPNSERVLIDYVHWMDFFHSQARNWYEVRWVAKRAYMSRAELVERFGPAGEECQLNSAGPQKAKRKSADEDSELLNQAEVYEVWDMQTKSVLWISEGYEQAPLDEQPDILKLDGFWPCPMPLLATTTTDSLYPTPDYKIYERLADELDYVTKRISAMAECIRYVGAHAAALGEEIKNILKLNDGQTWPIKNWQAFLGEKGGLQGAINWFPFDRCVEALQPLMQYQQSLIVQIDAITGIPDIVRGGTDPNETAAAIQRKSKWTMLKAAEKQQDVQRFCRDLISKMTQIIFEPGLFSDETIGLMCGYEMLSPEEQQLYPEALGVLRNDRLRTFKVDIETDSTIAVDEEEEQELRMQYVQAITSLVSSVQNVAQYRPELMKPIVQSALFSVRAFRTGRDLEGAWEKAFTEIEEADKAARENPPQPQPDPAMIAAQNDGQRVQIEMQKLQQDGAMQAQELQLKAQGQQADFELEAQKLQLEVQKLMDKSESARMDQELAAFKEQFAQYVETQRLELEKYATVLSEREKLIEESRLKQQETIETMKLLQQRVEIADRAPKESAPPIVHAHIYNDGEKEVEIKRMPDGSLRGKSRKSMGDA